MSVKEMMEWKRISGYARYNTEQSRRETWAEQIQRVMDMHREKYKHLLPELSTYLDKAENAMKKKKVLGSQRALQFGGPAILNKNARLYNCTVSYCDRPRFFQEAMWLLLCGCGVGFSVQKHHIEKLPNIKSPEGTKKYIIEDSVEGWADSIGELLNSFFNGTELPIFDFSKIRPAGELIKSSGSKAPGPEGLKAALKNIQELLYRCINDGQTRLKTIDAYDIVMFSSDAVLSGGVRRSATICLFSKDDTEMLHAKTGNWFIENPQRGRSNNSVVLIRNETTKKEFDEIMKSVKQFGEPGFVWTEDKEALYNPCITGDSLITTDKGNVQIKDLVGNEDKYLIKSFNLETKEFELKPLKYALKTKKNVNVIKLKFDDNTFLKCTPDHKILTIDGYKEAGKLNINDEIVCDVFNGSLIDIPEASKESYIETEKWNNRIIEKR